VTISERAATVGESSVWLTAGEQLSVEELLMATLIQSGNDAATALAEFNAGSVEAFVGKMNKRAAELGMASTHFTNPHGLDDPEHYTTASDYIILAQEFRKHPKLMEIVNCSQETISNMGQPDARLLINHNHLLDLFPVINGIKTGFTDAAGQCIIISADNEGVNLLLAYLGADSYAQRDKEVIDLVNYGLSLYRNETVIEQGGVYSRVKIPYSNDGELRLVAEEGRTGQIYYEHEVEHRLIVPEEMVLPVKKGDKVGLVSAYEGGTFIGSTYLIATEDVPGVSWTGKVGYYFESVFGILSIASLGALKEVFSA
jgi:D-alanyl-D-alanine carboxypeptidase (penicillin-binding protein 5/6)